MIQKNSILISNIIRYNNKYSDKSNLSEYESYDNLYNEWIKPIEPEDKSNYEKITQMAIDTNTTESNNSTHTDITCYRNFIQKDFKLNLIELFGDIESELKSMPILYTTYRIFPDSNSNSNSNSNVITILH
jgi:hypothetical protein